MPKAKVIVLRPELQPESWDDPMWWYGEARKLPPVVCPRCEHPAFAKYWVLASGRQLGYSCPLDGWEKVVLVQDGWGAQPQVPHDGQGVVDPPAAKAVERTQRRRKRLKEAVTL